MASSINGTSTGSGGLISTGDDSGILNIQTNETTAITVDAGQQIGVGTTSPSNFGNANNRGITINGQGTAGFIELQSSGTAYGNVYANSSNLGIRTPTALPILFETNGANERMRIDSSGNLLVNTTTAASKFCVNAEMSLLTDGNNRGIIGWDNTDKRISFGTINAGTAYFSAMSLRDGNLLVGTTTANARLTVETGSDEAVYAKNTAGASSATMLSWNNAGSGNNYLHAFFVDAGASNVGNIDYNRAAGLVRYNTTSDATLKNIIGDSDNQKSVEILNTTRIREFAWKSDVEQKTQIGVIAQELHETYKGAVSVGGNIEKTDEDGNVTTEYRPWGVDKTAFTFHLIAGWQAHEKLIQELKALTDTQAETINALTARIVALEQA